MAMGEQTKMVGHKETNSQYGTTLRWQCGGVRHRRAVVGLEVCPGECNSFEWGGTKSVQLVSIQVEDFGWVSTAEAVPGSDHIVVLAVPAAKSSDHMVPRLHR